MNDKMAEHPTMNPTFTISEVEATNTEAKLVFEPLENGYGHTLGNALRRVLLTSLPGCAIVDARVEGIDHQFASLEGMKEDVVELILNLKQVRIKGNGIKNGLLKINVKGPKTVTAASIKCDGGFEVVNPEQYIATVAKGKELVAELTVESNIGYTIADPSKSTSVGLIPIDALFSPVIRVSYDVEATRVGRRTDYDRLVMSVVTDGTITPLEAVKDAALILSKQFSQVFDPAIVELKEEPVYLSPEEQETLSLTVEELDLPTRIANALRKGGYATVDSLTKARIADVVKVKNLGEKSIQVINEALKKKGVTLASI